MAAKRLAPGERLLDIRAAEEVEGYQVQSRREGEAPAREVLTDTPPAAFTERTADASGEVRVSPLLEAVFQRLRARRAAARAAATEVPAERRD